MTTLRALVIGCIGSFRDCFMFQRKIAQLLGCSIRTVQRALAQGRALGLIECHRAKARENAPEIGKPLPCGWSHRWAIGWGRAKEAVQKLVNVARAKSIIPGAFRSTRRSPEPPTPHRRWTAEEIEAELARRQGQSPPN